VSAFRPCAIVPTFNHHSVLPDLISRFAARETPVIVIDDGSGPEAAGRIAAACAAAPNAECLRHEVNRGKGFAVLRGLERAAERGFSHAIQIDGDGQHDIGRLDALMAAARANPDAIVLGYPRYDGTVPRRRKFGRWLTHAWVFINTLSFDIKDSMCGFRVYPVAATLVLARAEVAGRRMEFDTEVLVRAHWRGTRFVGIPVDVTYPADNFSNFDLRRDNVLISGMHARLFLGMLARSPRLLRQKLSSTPDQEPRDSHWADIGERGASWGLGFLAAVYRVMGRRACLAFMSFVVFYFFVTGRKQRQGSMAYLDRAWKAGILERRPNYVTSFRHFMSFGVAALDKLAAWTGNIDLGDLDGDVTRSISATMNDGRGAFVITAHLGNPEAIRAVGTTQGQRINVLVHTVHAARFNRLIETLSPESATHLMQVTNLGPETAVALREAVERGEWVVMAGDRVAVAEAGERIVWIPFLGELAPFPQGPYILASLLRCPTYLLFGTRRGDRFDVHFRKLADPVVLPRGQRIKAIESYARQFAGAIEHQIRAAPFQWFNFFDFWRPAGLVPPTANTNPVLVEERRQ
jgi:predicted LPLAT superfamily acyltransferase